ncbi:hypothetical protein SMD44_08441 [Streptomyces alboflavus]|uniref:Uncharacterized protein n=1 Tax=Streptomyces alboflavus TaxID=67267 RepID=A0A1Z1WRC3_9ACTN|nr:hypothetical protein SMD44_08441 [Streptomyces alboflavus]
MTLRIHFTADDLSRTRMASGVRPLLELSIGIRLLQETTHPVRFDAWRQRAAARMHPRAGVLFAFIPPWVRHHSSWTSTGRTSSTTWRSCARPARQVTAELELWAPDNDIPLGRYGSCGSLRG